MLYSDRLKQQNGRISKADVAEVFRDHTVIRNSGAMHVKDGKTRDDHGNPLDYPPDKQFRLLRAMQQFKLCYVSTETPDTWIVPDLLPSDQPKNLDFDHRDALHLDFDFKSFLPRHVMNMFIVEHFRDIWRGEVWRHGVYLKSEEWRCHALVRANDQDRVLSIEVTGQHSDRYFSVLYDSILKILKRMPKLKYSKLLYLDERARISGGRIFNDNQQPSADFDDLLEMHAQGSRKYICKHGKYDLMEVLKLMPKQNTQSYEIKQTDKKDNSIKIMLLLLLSFLVVMGSISMFAWVLDSWMFSLVLVGGVIILLLIFIAWFLGQGKLTQKHFVNLSERILDSLPLLNNILDKFLSSKK